MKKLILTLLLILSLSLVYSQSSTPILDTIVYGVHLQGRIASLSYVQDLRDDLNPDSLSLVTCDLCFRGFINNDSIEIKLVTSVIMITINWQTLRTYPVDFTGINNLVDANFSNANAIIVLTEIQKQHLLNFLNIIGYPNVR